MLAPPKLKVIGKYIWKTILPYLLLAWTVLTVILFLQQSGSRFGEILFGAFVPWRLLLDLGAAMIVSVTSFVAPLAVLFGVVVGLGQLRGDSEIVAMFAAGFGRRRVVLPCLLLAAMVSLVALAINLEGVPFAARTIRRVALEAALAKLESPIEPGVFSVEFKNYVIYVRAGNKELGIWEKVFIYAPEKDQTKLITAESGRIDQSNDRSELVLSDAIVTTLPRETATQAATIEKVNGLRVTLDTGRQQLKQRLQAADKSLDEMGLSELAQRAAEANGRERVEARILWHRRLALALAPLGLALFGAAISLDLARGGKGFANLLALLIAIFYYLLIVAGEQTARAQIVPPFAGAWFPLVLLVVLSLLLLINRRRARTIRAFEFFGERAKRGAALNRAARFRGVRRLKYLGLLETDLFKNLLQYFALIGAGLLAVFLIFTTFEVLRAIADAPGNQIVLARYLLLLAPFVFVQIAPSVLMIAVLIVYTIKARRNEFAVWSAAGQSVYVLLLPAILTAVFVGALDWQLQEKVLPLTNPKQDALRAQLRGSGAVAQQENRYWLALDNGIISYTGKSASDNVRVAETTYYKFDAAQTHLIEMQKSSGAQWQNSAIELSGGGQAIIWQNSGFAIKNFERAKIETGFADNPFNQIARLSDLSATDLSRTIETVESDSERGRLRIVLQQKYAALILPFVTVLFSAPLVLSLRRQSLTAAIIRAIAVWLIFTATLAFFQRIGGAGGLPPAVAVWSPLLLFSSIGIFFLARART